MLSILSTFAQSTLSEPDVTTRYYYTAPSSSDSVAMGTILLIYLILFIVFGIPTIIGMWKMYKKAGQPGWASIVPVYNIIVLLRIVGRPTWWLVLYLLGIIPFLGIIPVFIASIINTSDLVKSFGKDVGWAVLLILVPYVGYPIMGFSKDIKYVGPAAQGGNNNGTGTPPTPTTPVEPAPPVLPAV